MKNLADTLLEAELQAHGVSLTEAKEAVYAKFGITFADTTEEANLLVGGTWPCPQVAGSKRYECENCGAAVSLAPSSQALLAQRAMPIICLSCALRNADA